MLKAEGGGKTLLKTSKTMLTAESSLHITNLKVSKYEVCKVKGAEKRWEHAAAHFTPS